MCVGGNKISTHQADFFCAQLWLQVNISRFKSVCQIPDGAKRRFLNLQLIVLPNLSVGNDLYFWASPMVRQQAMLGSPCQGPNCLMISYLGIDMVLISIIKNWKDYVRFILPARKTPASGSSFWESNSNSPRVRCRSITSRPCFEKITLLKGQKLCICLW